jgi:DNA polymerase III epsilon subunit-like protein
MNNHYVVDVETTNDNPFTGSILSLGAVRRRTREEFYGECCAWEGAEVTSAALGVNGFTRENIYSPDKMTEAELINKFFDWMGEKGIIIGMNPYFDYLFIKNVALRAGYTDKKIPVRFRTSDLHTLALVYACKSKIEIPETGFYTDAIYKMLGMAPEPRPHNALTGARMEDKAFHKLFYSVVR